MAQGRGGYTAGVTLPVWKGVGGGGTLGAGTQVHVTEAGDGWSIACRLWFSHCHSLPELKLDHRLL